MRVLLRMQSNLRRKRTLIPTFSPQRRKPRKSGENAGAQMGSWRPTNSVRPSPHVLSHFYLVVLLLCVTILGCTRLAPLVLRSRHD